MDSLTAAAASGMRARLESLDMLANNLANAATAGYKADREAYGLYVAPEALDPESPAPTVLPVIERQWTDFSQGQITTTGNPLDLALGKSGFFAVNTPGGAAYTRNGSFRLSASGKLETQDGHAVRLAGGGELRADPSQSFDVASDGSVRQGGAILGQLEIADFDRPQELVKAGRNYLRPAGQVTARPAREVEVHQGKLEASNVGTPETAVRLVSLMRQFEMLQKAISLGTEMGRRAIEEVARPGA